jgi:hypothetical protein
MAQAAGRWGLYGIWAFLAGASVYGTLTGQFAGAFVALVTLLLTLVPIYFSRRLGVHAPPLFVAAVALFLCATLFLGEVRGFYHRFWWWDIALHLWSAVGFAVMGAVLMLILVRGARLQGAPITVALFAFCFAVTIGAVWEIFEFAMDQGFGMNMQKSGLFDTMEDLIVDCLGAAVGAAAGFGYLKGLRGGPLTSGIRAFVGRNRHLFRLRPRRPVGGVGRRPRAIGSQRIE